MTWLPQSLVDTFDNVKAEQNNAALSRDRIRSIGSVINPLYANLPQNDLMASLQALNMEAPQPVKNSTPAMGAEYLTNEYAPQQEVGGVSPDIIAQLKAMDFSGTRGPASQEVASYEVPSQVAMSQGAQKNTQKQQSKEQTQVQKQQTDYEKKVRDYMTKREGIALDMKNRMAKLDSIYNNQGADLSSFGMLADEANAQQGRRSNFQQQLQSGRISPQQLEELKQKLAIQQNSVYGDVDKTARDMYRMNMTDDMSKRAADARLQAAALKGEKGSPLSGELIKRADNVTGMDTAVSAMEELDRKGEDQKWTTWLGQKTGIGDTEFGIHLRNAAEYYGRMQSGGAIQKEEDKRFISSLFKPMDTPEIRKKKFKVVRNMIKQRAQSLAAGRPTGSLPPALQKILKTGKGDLWKESQKFYGEDGQRKKIDKDAIRAALARKGVV